MAPQNLIADNAYNMFHGPILSFTSQELCRINNVPVFCLPLKKLNKGEHSSLGSLPPKIKQTKTFKIH